MRAVYRMLFPVLLGLSFVSIGQAGANVVSLKEIREEGVIIQKWDTSCGAAAMATVFTFSFDDPVSERDVVEGLLRQTEALTVRHRGGFSLLDMKRYAERRGYRATGFLDMSFEDIQHIEAPIIPVNFHGYSHYVVFKGLTPDGQVHLADPAFGNRYLNRRDFYEAWMNGVAFVMMRHSS